MNGRITAAVPGSFPMKSARIVLKTPYKAYLTTPVLYMADGARYTVALFDFGMKETSEGTLKRGCNVRVFRGTPPDDVLALGWMALC